MWAGTEYFWDERRSWRWPGYIVRFMSTTTGTTTQGALKYWEWSRPYRRETRSGGGTRRRPPRPCARASSPRWHRGCAPPLRDCCDRRARVTRGICERTGSDLRDGWSTVPTVAAPCWWSQSTTLLTASGAGDTVLRTRMCVTSDRAVRSQTAVRSNAPILVMSSVVRYLAAPGPPHDRTSAHQKNKKNNENSGYYKVKELVPYCGDSGSDTAQNISCNLFGKEMKVENRFRLILQIFSPRERDGSGGTSRRAGLLGVR